VATNPLSVDGWEQFLPGEMKVLHEGTIAFTGRPGLHDGKGEPKKPAEAISLMPSAAESQGVLTGEKSEIRIS
jgi:hypothetical protein